MLVVGKCVGMDDVGRFVGVSVVGAFVGGLVGKFVGTVVLGEIVGTSQSFQKKVFVEIKAYESKH